MPTLFANVLYRQTETDSSPRTPEASNCQHPRRCPDATAPDFRAARVVADQPSQGWSLLCNGVILFDDGGVLLPEDTALAPGALSPSLGVAVTP
jgi:Family of unknown function (DUF5999)